MAQFHRTDECGIFPHCNAQRGEQWIFPFSVSFRLRQNDDVSRIAEMLESAERNRIGDASVEHFTAVHAYDVRSERHGRRRLQPFHFIAAERFAPMVNGLPRFDVGTRYVKRNRRRFERVVVVRIEFFRQFAPAKIRVE